MHIDSLSLYQVMDRVAQQPMGPLFASRHDAAAIRMFTDGLKDERTSLHQHPEDYALVHVGYQETTSGKVEGLEEPRLVLSGKQWVDMTTPGSQPPGEVPNLRAG